MRVVHCLKILRDVMIMNCFVRMKRTIPSSLHSKLASVTNSLMAATIRMTTRFDKYAAYILADA